MKINIDTPSFNERRYGKPWIASVDFTDPKGDFTFGDWIGDGRNGSSGLLEIDADPGDILATGQKDSRQPRNSSPDFFQVVGPADRDALREKARSCLDSEKIDAKQWPEVVKTRYCEFPDDLTPSDHRDIVEACTGEKIGTRFKGNVEVRELSKPEALKAWRAEQERRAAPLEIAGPFAAFSDAEILAEAQRRSLITA